MTKSDATDPPPGVRTLVLGYGSSLRRDDALGVMVAHEVEALGLSGVEVLTMTQLVPELAERLSQSQRVVFVDARAAKLNQGVEVQQFESSDNDSARGLGWTHVASIELLLYMSERIYGHRPQAWLVSVPAFDLGFGEGLSEPAMAGFAAAVARVRELLAP